MATATLTPTADKSALGFAVRCPLCGQEGGVSLKLADLESCSCGECGEDFSLTDVRAMLAAWGEILAWVESAPSVK